MRAAGRLAPLLRLTAFLGFAGLAACALLFRSIGAQADEALHDLGAEVMQYPGEPPEPARQLVLNGVSVAFRTQAVRAPLERVLEHYRSLCASRSAGFAVPLSAQSASNSERGYVACLDTGHASADLRALAERFVRFAQTGDLSAMGGLRYVHARRAPGDDATLLFTMWADSALDLFRMLPGSEVDAGGSDPPGVPRPPGSQRLLSAWESNQPSRVFVYRAKETSELQVESFYRSQLLQNGWTVLERHPSQLLTINGARLISAEREGRTITVLVSPGESSSITATVLATNPPLLQGFRP
jgi:hypothetical protein